MKGSWGEKVLEGKVLGIRIISRRREFMRMPVLLTAMLVMMLMMDTECGDLADGE